MKKGRRLLTLFELERAISPSLFELKKSESLQKETLENVCECNWEEEELPFSAKSPEFWWNVPIHTRLQRILINLWVLALSSKNI